jgi:hypothetical protein
MVLTILSAAVAAVVLLFGEHVFYRDLQAVASAKKATWRHIVDKVESGDITCGDGGFQLKLEPLTAKEGIEMVVPLGTPVGAIKRPTPISIQDPYCRVPFGKPKGSYLDEYKTDEHYYTPEFFMQGGTGALFELKAAGATPPDTWHADLLLKIGHVDGTGKPKPVLDEAQLDDGVNGLVGGARCGSTTTAIAQAAPPNPKNHVH